VLSGEYGILDSFIDGKAAIGVGGYLAYAGEKLKGFDMKVSHFILAARGLFHYQFVDRLDTYAGLALGYESVSVSNGGGYNYGDSSGVFPSLFLGARYYFNDRLAAFGELGYGVAPLELGIALKF
jgi:hypothetical protein